MTGACNASASPGAAQYPTCGSVRRYQGSGHCSCAGAMTDTCMSNPSGWTPARSRSASPSAPHPGRCARRRMDSARPTRRPPRPRRPAIRVARSAIGTSDQDPRRPRDAVARMRDAKPIPGEHGRTDVEGQQVPRRLVGNRGEERGDNDDIAGEEARPEGTVTRRRGGCSPTTRAASPTRSAHRRPRAQAPALRST